MKKIIALFVLVICLLQTAYAFTVVIDAGHGGKDPGACGQITTEKALNLAIAQRLNKLIKDSCPDVSVFLTRNSDVFLSLQERADFVNKHSADLFICVHANASENKKLSGAETYVLGLHKLDSNFEVAKRENSVIMLEDDYQTKYQGFDPNSVESYIMFEFMQDRFLNRSLQFAELMQQKFVSVCGRTNRDVRQAGFWVLHKSACPSVLIETGFISNPEEERYLVSEKGKQEITMAIYQAFVEYKSSVDKKQETTEAAKNANINDTKTQETIPIASADTENKANTKSAKAEKKNTKKTSAAAPVFRVQIFSVTSELKAGDPSFKGLKGCKYTKDGKYLKYTYGEETSYEAIEKLRNSLLPKFKDCFIVAFLDGKQIYVREALEMIK